MAMPKKKTRHIVVDGSSYRYALKNGRSRYVGESGPTLRLVVEMEGGRRYESRTFLSKSWTDDHAAGLTSHRAEFRPSDVERVIRHLVFDPPHRLPIELDRWREVRPV